MSIETEQQLVLEETQQVLSKPEESSSSHQTTNSQDEEPEQSLGDATKPQLDENTGNQDNEEQDQEEEASLEEPKSGEAPLSANEAEIKVEEEVQQEQQEESDIKKHYKAVIAEAEELYEELIDREMWNLDSDKDGIKGYSRHDVATGLKMARGEGVIERPVDMISRIILEPASILKWEGNLVSHEVVETLDDYEVIRSLDKKRPLVSQRETLLLTKIKHNEDGSIVIVQKSFSHDDYPEKKGYVRAFVNMCSWTLTPDAEDPNTTHGTYIIFVDPKGWVPKPVFNAFVSDQASNIRKLRNYIEKL